MATLDVVSYDEALAYLRSPGNRDGLDVWIEAISLRLDELCGPIVQRAVTDNLDGGSHTLFLNSRPVASITSVSEYANTTLTTLTAETNATKPAQGYCVRLSAGIVYRRSSNGDTSFASGRQNVVVVYSAGRYASTSVVGAKFKQACLIVLKHMWDAERGTGNSSYGAPEELVAFGPAWLVPKRAIDLLAGEIQTKASFA